MDIRTALNGDDEIPALLLLPAHMNLSSRSVTFLEMDAFFSSSSYLYVPSFQEEDFLLFIAYSSFEYQAKCLYELCKCVCISALEKSAEIKHE